MNRKSVLAVVFCLVLVIGVALPGTLAVSADQDSTTAELSITDEAVTPAPEETPDAEKPDGESAVTEETPSDAEEAVEIAHTEDCSESCTDAECKCACHLFNKIMACTTLDDIWAAFDEASNETINALTDEQNAQIDAKIEALEPAPAPAVVIEESDEETVPSEIVYRTVNYTFVAPFGDPVTGGHR